jgi:tight adherence protein B
VVSGGSARRRGCLALGAGLLAVFGVVGATAPAAVGQEPAEAPPGVGSLDVVAVDVTASPAVAVTVAVPRELVGTDIPATAFTVTEAGQARDATVERVPNEGLEVVLVVDTSGSMQGAPIAAARAAASQFLASMPLGTAVAVVSFGATGEVRTPFTTDLLTAQATLGGLEARGETALHDALVLASAQFPPGTGARRALVLLSDGGDTVSTATLDDAVAAVVGTGARLYELVLATPETDLPGLAALAERTGARSLAATDADQLAAAYADIAAELQNQYRVTFTAAASGLVDVVLRVEHGGIVAEAARTVDVPAVAVPPPPPAPPPTTAAPVTTAAPAPTTAPAPVPVEPRLVRVETGALGGAWVIVVGAGCVFGALLVGGVVLMQRTRPRRRLAVELGVRTLDDGRHGARRLVDRAAGATERVLERRGHARGVALALEQAGVSMQPGEFLVLALAVAVASTLVASVLLPPLLALAIGALVLVGVRALVQSKARARRQAFTDQLPGTLQLMAGAIRSGHGLSQAIDTVAQESEVPTSEEFRRVVTEARLGRDLGVALRLMAERLDDEDLDWVVQAIEIQREVGGDLAEVLDNVGATIRDRNRVRGTIAALSADGRISAWVLGLLPVIVGLALALVNPDYVGELTERGVGQVMLAVSGALLVIGWSTLRRLVRPVF